MVSELEDVIGLLQSENPKIVLQTCEYFCGLSGGVEGLNFILSHDNLYKHLMQFTANESSEIALLALKTITNCSQNENGVYLFISCDKDHFCTRTLLAAITRAKNDVTKASLLLIENISRVPSGARHFWAFIHKNDLYQELFSLFLTNNELYFDLSLVFGNLCQLSSVRKLFLEDEGKLFHKMLAFLNHENAACRLGAANLVKNCCFEKEFHQWMLKDDSIIACILLPLAGPEELSEEENESLPIDVQYLPSDKTRESVKDVVISLVQALHKLCATRSGREALRKYNVYVILRELDMATVEREGNERMTFEIHNVVQILIGDEEDHLDDLQSLEVPADVQTKLEQFDSQNTT